MFEIVVFSCEVTVEISELTGSIVMNSEGLGKEVARVTKFNVSDFQSYL